MNNLSIALAMILATETPDMDTQAVGDLHLPLARRAFGRCQIRKPVLDDLTAWDGGRLIWIQADSQNPDLDVPMAARWLRHYCGSKASVRRYLQTWNGGRTGWRSPDAQAYYKRAVTIKATRPQYYWRCIEEIRRFGI